MKGVEKMETYEQRNAELEKQFKEINKALTLEGIECWTPPGETWGAVIMPQHDREYVLSISPAGYYGWLVSLNYTSSERGHGKGCSCNPGNGHEGIVEINRAVLEECLRRGLAFAGALKTVKLHTKESYLKKNPTYERFVG